MANLSQMRRQRMLAFLSKMREQHKDDDEVLVAINEVENEITEKKYGLVWEEHSEEVEERMVEEVPVFTEVHDKEIALTDDGYNFLLEGDNLHSLHLLEKTHKEKIDVIYIDPPYNTGNNDFRYDDNYVGKDDAFRHSKWLSFIACRLSIAKRLLSPSGVAFISIDDNEHSQLRLLCDSVFGEDNFLAELPRITKKGGKSSDIFAKNNDYVLCYAKDRDCVSLNPVAHDDEGFRYKDEYFNERGAFKLNQTLDYDSLGYSDSLDYPIEIEGEVYLPGGDEEAYRRRKNGEHRRADWAWRWSKDLFQFGLDNGFIVIKFSGKRPRIYTKTYQNATIRKDGNKYEIIRREQTKALSTLETTDNIYSNDNAKKELDAVIGKEAFDYPKPTTLIKLLVQLGLEKSGTVLDFFAGSGTTGQAVLELNKEDGGNRKFILCTNNENNICEGVTYPRLQTVITGMRQDGNKYSDGIPANLKYYKTDYIPKKSDNLSADLIKHIDEMIQLEYHVKIDKDKYISVLTDEDADELEKNWQNFPNIRAIYISRSVLLTGKQRELFETKDCFVIPDYYFREELRDAGEA